MSDLDELRRLAEAATPGPWHPLIDNYGEDTWPGSMFLTNDPAEGQAALCRDLTQDDARFIAAAVNYVRDRLAATSDPAPLDAAWNEVQAVLPAGWYVELYDQGEHGPFNPAPDQPFGTPRYLAQANLGILSSAPKMIGTSEDTPAAALQALAAKLRDTTGREPSAT